MEHIKTTLAEDDLHDLALERCECGQFSLSVGPVTIQLEEETVLALARMLNAAVDASQVDEDGMTGPVPPDVQ
jgi:hypothetical protein